MTKKSQFPIKKEIDIIFYDNIQHSNTFEELDKLFESYLLFYDTYQEFISEDLALFFLDRVRLDIKAIPKNVIKMQKK
jgi:hypothetical protein